MQRKKNGWIKTLELEKMKKVKVEIHVAKEEHKKFASCYGKPLDQAKIKYEIVVDKKTKNRKYPYYTVNDRNLCLRRTINAAKGRT